MTELSASGPIDKWSEEWWARSARPERRCTAHRKNGDRCKNAARRGTNVCDFHGAKAPQVKHKARQRIEEAADRMACELLKMATDDNVADSVKLTAIRDALDRAGLAARSAVSLEVGPPKPYQAILESIEAGSRAEYRRSRGISDSEYRPSVTGFRALPPADTYHVGDDFTVDDDEAVNANNQAAQARSALGANENKQKGNTI